MDIEHRIMIAVAWADIIARAIGRMLPVILLLVIVLAAMWMAGRR